MRSTTQQGTSTCDVVTLATSRDFSVRVLLTLLPESRTKSVLEAHSAMNTQALGSGAVREGLKDVLLGPAQLYEALREQTRPE
jgi:hypothetical protein